MAIASELNVFSIREADVHLAAGLPLTWIRNQRKAFRSYLLQDPEVHYRFNGKKYHLRFVGCSLYPQGYPAIVNHLHSKLSAAARLLQLFQDCSRDADTSFGLL